MKRKNAFELGAEVIEHWYALIPAQQFSVQEFYQHIEEEIDVQRVPSLAITRVAFPEGGILSDDRVYLRMKRERLTFDVCAAPVGVNYFFSYRFYAEPVVVSWDQLVVLFVVLAVAFTILFRNLGAVAGTILFVLGCGSFVLLMKNAIGLGLRDVDTSLMKLPLLGSIYERFFRKETYFREDMRIAYCSIVSAIVKKEVETITAAKGVFLYREFTYSPLFEGLYRAKQVNSTAVPPDFAENANDRSV